MFEVIFLWVLALAWIIFAVVQDIRKHEIADWLNFSLLIFALGFRFFYSLFASGNFNFFFQGLIGFGIFFILENLLYYGKMFAGGDAKLLMALGVVLPIYDTLIENASVFFMFFLLFFITGMIYSFTASGILAAKNSKAFNNEFKIQFKKYAKLIYLGMIFGIGILLLGFFESALFILGILIFLLPLLYIFTKAVDEACMVKEIVSSKLTEGDWLYENVRVGRKVIKAKWDGVDKEEIKLLKKLKKVKIKQGIAFSPVFLIAFVILFLWILFGKNLWNPFW